MLKDPNLRIVVISLIDTEVRFDVEISKCWIELSGDSQSALKK